MENVKQKDTVPIHVVNSYKRSRDAASFFTDLGSRSRWEAKFVSWSFRARKGTPIPI